MDKQKAIIILLVVLIVLVIGYIGRDLYLGLQQNMLLAGYEIAVEEMISEAKNKECAPFPIFIEDEVVHLINIECLEGDIEGLEGAEIMDPEMTDPETMSPEMDEMEVIE